MAQERQNGQEKSSVWNSRLFKGGLIFAVAGAAFGLAEVAAVGVIVAGAGAGWYSVSQGKK